jgi:hypothetical protein
MILAWRGGAESQGGWGLFRGWWSFWLHTSCVYRFWASALLCRAQMIFPDVCVRVYLNPTPTSSFLFLSLVFVIRFSPGFPPINQATLFFLYEMAELLPLPRQAFKRRRLKYVIECTLMVCKLLVPCSVWYFHEKAQNIFNFILIHDWK